VRLLSRGRALLAENLADEALRHGELRHDMVDATAAVSGAQKFPEAASFRTSFSSVRSDTAFRNRLFSFSSSFRRFTWSRHVGEVAANCRASRGAGNDSNLYLPRARLDAYRA
jgi:hypothetical protein